MIALICAIILGFTSIWLFDKYPVFWIILVLAGGLYLLAHKREVWVCGRWKDMILKDRLARDTTAPPNAVKAVQERYALNKEAKTDNTDSCRMREIAKRLIFIDGYLAAKKQ